MAGVLELSDEERRVYLRLLRGALSLSETDADSAGAAARALEPALDGLVEKGLVVRVATRPAMFVAVPLDAVEAMARAERLRAHAVTRAVVTRLSTAFARQPGLARSDLAEVVLGESECNRGFQEVLRGARGEVLACESSYSVSRGTPAHGLVREQLARGVRFRVLYDRGGFENPERVADLGREVSAGEEARIVEVPLKLVLTDEPIGWVALRHPAYGNFARLRVREPALLGALSALFEMLWEQAMPLPDAVGAPLDAASTRPGAAGDETLAWLLAAGLSERGIADYLGCHERTARRRIRVMMAELDAHTAFQAGYQLARRGHRARAQSG